MKWQSSFFSYFSSLQWCALTKNTEDDEEDDNDHYGDNDHWLHEKWAQIMFTQVHHQLSILTLQFHEVIHLQENQIQLYSTSKTLFLSEKKFNTI